MAFDLKHALDVAMRVDGLEAKIVALLHDALEDGACTVYDLCDAELSDEIVGAVEALTRSPDETYDDYIARIRYAGGELAVYVKNADLDANLARLDSEHASLAGRYRKAQQTLASPRRLPVE